MEIEQTPLYREVLEVFRTNDQRSQIGWSATIHLDDQGTLYTPLQVTQLSLRRDYVQGYADEMSCTLLIPLGKYARQIYPNRKQLQITLYRAPLLEHSTQLDFDAEMQTERYSATLIEDGPAVTPLQGQETNDEYALDLVDLLEVRFQLFNKAVERLRMRGVGGIFRNTTLKDCLLSVSTLEALKVQLDGQRLIEGVDLVEPNNAKTYDQLVITQGVSLIDLPDYLQKKYGVYTTGMGAYLQNKYWYIYPLYDLSRFERALKTLTVYILPKRKFPEIERTYRKKGDSLVILATAQTEFVGDNTVHQLNQGNGLRFTDSAKFLESFGQTAQNKTVVARAQHTSELITAQKDDGLNYAPMHSNRITSNPFPGFSALAARTGGIFKMLWENSDPSLVEPGMISKLVYFDEGDIQEVYGTLLAATHVSTKVGDFHSKKHVSHSQLLFYTQLPIKQT